MKKFDYLEILKKEFLKASDDYLELYSQFKMINMNLRKEKLEIKKQYLNVKNKWLLASKKFEEELDKIENKVTNQDKEK